MGAQKTTLAGVLMLFGYFTLLCALLLAAAAGWYGYRRHVELARWPAAVASVSGCRVHTSYDAWHGDARALHHVECVFRYATDDVARTVTSRVGDTVSVVRGRIEITLPAVSLGSVRQWVRRHPDGATETIHWDPADPGRISLAGVDDDVSTRTPGAYARAAAIFAALGGVFLAGGVLARRREEARASARNARARDVSGAAG
jgi:hypothetical protein